MTVVMYTGGDLTNLICACANNRKLAPVVQTGDTVSYCTVTYSLHSKGLTTTDCSYSLLRTVLCVRNAPLTDTPVVVYKI